MPTKRKTRKKPVTPPSRIRSVLRGRVWMWSRERAEALKRDGRRCRACGSRENLECHHLDGSGIDEIIALIYQRLLCHPDRLVTLCKTCHAVTEPHDFAHDGTCKDATLEIDASTSGTRMINKVG